MQVLVRALAVLKLVARSSRGMTMGEIAERLDLPPASAHRLLRVLEDEGFVSRSRTNRRFFLGPSAREIGSSPASRESPLIEVHPAIRSARKVSGETVFVSQLSGDNVVCLALAESVHPLRLFVQVGQTMPLHAAAAARALLAWRDEDEVRRVLAAAPFTRFTVDTPTSAEEVLDHLVAVRRRGYDVCDSELDENVWAVSAPVRASTGDVVASVTLAAPEQRAAGPEVRDRLIVLILSTAERMSLDLGWNESAKKGGPL